MMKSKPFSNEIKEQFPYKWILVLLFAFFTFGCANQNPTLTSTIKDDNGPIELTPTNIVKLESTPTPSQLSKTDRPDVETVVEVQQEQTPTLDVRLNPDDWMNWPVVPTLSERAKNIYLSGLALGRDTGSFSKVGDCQSIREVLLGIYDLPGRYVLQETDDHLQETIDQFSGSYNRDGYAVKGGFNAATVLSPIWSDPEVCLAGETPLACEFRIHNPSMVIISLEVWWDGRTPDRYEQYLRKIIEYSISQGVLPILSTKADNVEGDHSINAVNARLAYEYDIPLWNFWLAAQALPYQGIDPARDGFHITVAAWNERSYTALKTIDEIWRSANPEGNEIGIEPIVPLAPLSEIEIVDYSQSLSQVFNLPGHIVFELTRNNSGGIPYPAGIYMLSFEDNALTKIVPENYSLLSINGSEILVRNGQTNSVEKWQLTGGLQELIFPSGFASTGGAIFYDTSHIIAMGTYQQEDGIWLVDPSNKTVTNLVLTDTENIEVESTSEGKLFWKRKGTCERTSCPNSFLYVTDIETKSTIEINNVGTPLIDNKGENFLYYLTQDETESIYFSSINLGTSQSQYVGLYGNVLLDYAWASDGKSFAVLKMVRSDYFGKATEVLHYIVDIESLFVREYPAVFYLSPKIVWEPGNAYFLTSGTTFDEDEDEGYGIGLRVVAMNDGTIHDIGNSIDIGSEKFVTINQIFWIP